MMWPVHFRMLHFDKKKESIVSIGEDRFLSDLRFLEGLMDLGKKYTFGMTEVVRIRRLTVEDPCYSGVLHEHCLEAYSKCRIPDPISEPLYQKLHFNQIPRAVALSPACK